MVKDKQIKFRLSADKAQRYKVALELENKTLSDVCRDALERFARKAEKKHGVEREDE